MNIYISNLAREVNEDDLRKAFGQFGAVTSVAIIKDKATGEPKGFAFVEMPNAEEGKAAIAGVNGKEIKGRALSVNEARPKGSGGGGNRGGGFGGGRGERSMGVSRGLGRGRWKGLQ